MDALDIRKGAVDEGNGVCHDDVGLAAELVKDLGESEDGADGVAVGAGVGGEDEPGRGAECLQERGDRSFWGHGLGDGSGVSVACFFSRLRVRVRSSSMRLVIFWERSMAKVISGT